MESQGWSRFYINGGKHPGPLTVHLTAVAGWKQGEVKATDASNLGLYVAKAREPTTVRCVFIIGSAFVFEKDKK